VNCADSINTMAPKRSRNENMAPVIDLEVSADSLLLTGAESVAASAGNDQAKIARLLSFSKALETAATEALRRAKLAVVTCVACEEHEVTRNCTCCDEGFCDAEECALECHECGECICEKCGGQCDFDDGCGGAGCEEVVSLCSRRFCDLYLYTLPRPTLQRK
jgi:hypothetical protein